MTSPAIVSRSNPIERRKSAAWVAILLAVRTPSPLTISFERRKKSAKIAVAFTMRYTAPAILAARWGERVARSSVSVHIVINHAINPLARFVMEYASRSPKVLLFFARESFYTNALRQEYYRRFCLPRGNAPVRAG